MVQTWQEVHRTESESPAPRGTSSIRRSRSGLQSTWTSATWNAARRASDSARADVHARWIATLWSRTSASGRSSAIAGLTTSSQARGRGVTRRQDVGCSGGGELAPVLAVFASFSWPSNASSGFALGVGFGGLAGEAKARARGSTRAWTTAVRCRAAFSWRLPPRSKQRLLGRAALELRFGLGVDFAIVGRPSSGSRTPSHTALATVWKERPRLGHYVEHHSTVCFSQPPTSSHVPSAPVGNDHHRRHTAT